MAMANICSEKAIQTLLQDRNLDSLLNSIAVGKLYAGIFRPRFLVLYGHLLHISYPSFLAIAKYPVLCDYIKINCEKKSCTR